MFPILPIRSFQTALLLDDTTAEPARQSIRFGCHRWVLVTFLFNSGFACTPVVFRNWRHDRGYVIATTPPGRLVCMARSVNSRRSRRRLSSNIESNETREVGSVSDRTPSSAHLNTPFKITRVLATTRDQLHD